MVAPRRTARGRAHTVAAAALAAASCADNSVGVVVGDGGVPSYLGTWRNCTTDLRLDPDGTWERTSMRNTRCVTRGRWHADGDRLDLLVATSTCVPAATSLLGVRVAMATERLLLLHPDIAPSGMATYLLGSLPHVRWRISGVDPTHPGEVRVSIVRVVGEPSGATGSGCYWSEDGYCGGLLSCTGTVTQWRTTDGVINAGTSCVGECTCGASLNGTVDAQSMEVRLTHENCKGVWQTMAHGERISDD